MEDTELAGQLNSLLEELGESESLPEEKVSRQSLKSYVTFTVIATVVLVSSILTASWFMDTYSVWFTGSWAKKELPMVLLSITIIVMTLPAEPLSEQSSLLKSRKGVILEGFICYRMIMGFPVFQFVVDILGRLFSDYFSYSENFVFNISTLTLVWLIVSRTLTADVLTPVILPVFAMHCVLIFVVDPLWNVLVFPFQITSALLEGSFLFLFGNGIIQPMILKNVVHVLNYAGIDDAGLHLPSPHCLDAYHDALLGSSTDHDSSSHCLVLVGNELYSTVFSLEGILRSCLFLILLEISNQLQIWSFTWKRWKNRKSTVLQLERFLLEAKNHPFRANVSFLGSSIKKSTETLQEALQVRAKDRHVTQLHATLVELHGQPDMMEVLFDKERIFMNRSSSLFVQLADQVMNLDIHRLKNGLRIEFDRESGVDAGGVSSELFRLVADEVSNAAVSDSTPCPKMFKVLPDSTLFLCRNPKVDVAYYFCLGRIIGLSLLHNHIFPIPLSSAMLKVMHTNSDSIDAEDVRTVDPMFFQNRFEMLLEPNGIELMKDALAVDDIPFVWITNEGIMGDELCPFGSTIFVDDDNKLQYVRLLSEYYLFGDIREILQVFLSGFHEIVPLDTLAKHGNDYVDLALAIQGISEISVEDWMAHTKLPDEQVTFVSSDGATFVTSDTLLAWFWEIVSEMNQENRARLLQFCSGQSKSPVGGFKYLLPRQFNICFDNDASHFPTSLTCLNNLRLPAVHEKSILRDRLFTICMHPHFHETFGNT